MLRRNETAGVIQEELGDLQQLRRSTFDMQIQPIIASHVHWLNHRDPVIKSATVPETADQAPKVAQILNTFGHKLNEAITSAETDGRFDSYFLRLYDTAFGRYGPAAPDFHFLPRTQFDKAASELLSVIQGTIPLSTSYSWEDITRIYEQQDKQMPPLPSEVIYIDEPVDPGFINDEIRVSLPTKIPLVLLDYTFHLWEGPENVQPASSPQSIAIRVVTL